MSDTQLPAVTQSAAPAIDYSNAEIMNTLKATVALGATDVELAMFIELAKSTGLNPFKREIWFIKGQGYTRNDGTEVPGKLQVMTGFNGFLEIANSHPEYDGLECDIEMGSNGYPTRAVCRVHRKDRKYPSVGEALWKEDSQELKSHNGKLTVWGKRPSVMLAKVAKCRALREAFPQKLGGLLAEEEMPPEYSIGAATFEAPPEERRMIGDPKPATPPEPIVAEVSPDLYKLEAPKSTFGDKKMTLAEIHKKDPRWIHASLTDPKRKGLLTARDRINCEAFWAAISETEAAQRACTEEFDREAAWAEAAKIEAEQA